MTLTPDRSLRMLAPLAMASAIAFAPVAAALLSIPAHGESPGAASKSGAASKKQPMKLLKLTVTGNKQVPTSAIDSAMTIKVGQKVTRDDLQANLNAIVDVYRHANVGASFKQKMTIPHPGQVLVAYMIEEQAPAAAAAPAGLQADKVTFEGNNKIKTEAIQSVITIKPGEPVDTDKVKANMQAILDLYKKAGIGVQITPSASYPQPNHVIVDYRIEEKSEK